MSSHSRNSDHQMSLPGIREMFPELHLMNPPHIPGPSRIGPQPHHNPEPARITYSPNCPPSSHPQTRASTLPHPHDARSPPSNYWRHIGDSRTQPLSSATLPPRPQDAPPYSSQTVDGWSVTPQPTSSIPLSHGTYQRNRHESIPPMHPGRAPMRQTPNGHPDVQPIASSDPSHSRSMRHPGPSSSSSPSPQALEDSGNPTDDETVAGGAPSGIPRKHICIICGKAFNRPSSLKIHYNTHTGETPFRCPWPKCGREFNVNSNMRRHLRNHTANTAQETQDDGARRRRRRSSAGSSNPPVTVMMQQQQSASETRAQPQNHHHHPRHHHHQVPPPPHFSVPPPTTTPNTSRHQVRYDLYHHYSKDDHGMEVDDVVDEYHVSEDPHRSSRVSVPVTRILETPAAEPAEPRGTTTTHSASRYNGTGTGTGTGIGAPAQPEYHPFHHSSSSPFTTNMRIRALTPGSSFHSSSPSPSPSPSLSPTSSSFNSPPASAMTSPSPAHSPAGLPPPPPSRAQIQSGQQQYQYSPSMPYLRDVRDSHVSTALRPAFNVDSNAVVVVRR